MISFSPDLPIEAHLTNWFSLHSPTGELKAFTSSKDDIKQFYKDGDSINELIKLIQYQSKPIDINDL